MATSMPSLAPSPLSGLRRHGRLLHRDFRRAYGVPLVLVMVLLGIYGAILLSGSVASDIVLWGAVSSQVAWAFVLIGPVAGAWGAWLADRERRTGTGDLLSSIAMPAPLRDARVLVGAVVTALLAYGVVAGVTIGRAWPDSTWGGPVWPVIVMGAVFTAGYALVGTTVGMRMGGRLTPFIVLFLLMAFTIVSYTYIHGDSRYQHLAPFRWVSDAHGYDQILYRADGASWSGIAVPVALTLGVAVLALVVLLLARGQRGKGAVAAVFAALILVPSVNAAIEHPAWLIPGTNPGSGFFEGTPVENPPLVCTGDSVELCVHVIYINRMDSIGRIVDALIAPVEGLPGTDIRIEQRADLPSTDEVVRFQDDWVYSGDDYAVANVVASALLPAPPPPPGAEIPESDLNGPRTPVQGVMAQWLTVQAGLPPFVRYEYTVVPHPGPMATQVEWEAHWDEDQRVQNEVDVAAERFGALPDDVRDAWLAENWDAVRAGELTLEDIP